ncbi:MAG: PIN domain-containing protein [Methanocellales archaeon]|nr:PIN domain-containing protein [Methanocellales archaeon]
MTIMIGMKLVPDTSVIIDGRITAKIESGEFEGAKILIPEAVVTELEAQANQGREVGFSGLEELKKLNEMAKEDRVTLEYTGESPTLEQIKLASRGAIDAMIRAVAVQHKAVFIDMGQITKVYDVLFTVKVPHGMIEEGLSRPVIDVVNFESGRTEYEIYSYGDQVVVVPVETPSRPAWSLAEKEIHKVIGKYARGHIDVVMISDGKAIVYLDKRDIPRVLGKDGKTIDRIESVLGVSIDVCEKG